MRPYRTCYHLHRLIFSYVLLPPLSLWLPNLSKKLLLHYQVLQWWSTHCYRHLYLGPSFSSFFGAIRNQCVPQLQQHLYQDLSSWRWEYQQAQDLYFSHYQNRAWPTIKSSQTPFSLRALYPLSNWCTHAWIASQRIP